LPQNLDKTGETIRLAAHGSAWFPDPKPVLGAMRKTLSWLFANCKFATKTGQLFGVEISASRDVEISASRDDDPKKSFIQWMTSDNRFFFPAASVAKALPPGFYDMRRSMSGEIFFEKSAVSLEGIMRFPETSSDSVIDEIETFWEKEDEFRQKKLAYKRGILLYGPPGSGKTCTVKIILANVVKRNGIAFKFPGPDLFVDAMKVFREIQEGTPVIVLMEDIDAILNRHSESDVLNILDGVTGVDKCVFLATTNYPEKLSSRTLNRPSRFDKRILIGMPNSESRRIYLETKLKSADEIDRWVKDTEGLSIAHLKELVIAVKILDEPYKEALETLREMRKSIRSTDFDDYGAEEANRNTKMSYPESQGFDPN